MADYKLITKSSWATTVSEIEESLRKWGAVNVDINYPRGARSEKSYQELEERTVTLSYNLKGKNISIRYDKQNRAVDNLRVLYICIESMRMNERRGISDELESMYLQLAAPQGKRDPYEVLGIRPESPIEVCEAVYRTMASKYHPDSKPDGDAIRFKELAEAIAEVRKQKTAS